MNGWSTWKTDGVYKSGTSYVSNGSGIFCNEYRVRAHNAGGASSWIPCRLKDSSSVEPLPPDKPDKPKYVSAVWTSPLAAIARVSWPAVSGAESYTIGYKEKGANLWCSGSVKSTSETISGLNKNTSYDFQVKAVNSTGSSDWVRCSLDSTTTIVSIVTYAENKNSVPPSTIEAPTGVSGTWTSTGSKWQARISWNAVSGATLYEVQYKTPAMSEWKADRDYSSGTSYISTGLGNYNSYEYRVRAVNGTGASDWTEYTLVKSAGSDPTPEPTPGPQVPAAPANVSGTWTSTGPKWQARISWNPVSVATRYEVQYRTPKTGNAWRTDADYSSGTSYISTGLGDYNSYDYRVRAINAAGASEWTEYTLIKTVSVTGSAPTAPTGVSGTWTSRGPKWQARISWNPVSGATRYEVQYRTPRTNNEWRADTDYSSGTSYISTGLGTYNSYDYRVRAVSANGASEWTEYTLYK